MSDKELIKICLEEISRNLGYEDPGSLRQRDLEHLCQEIEKRTNILISLSTIKRLLNGQFNRLPQVATLNAITSYLGYQNWQDFKIRKQGEVRVTTERKTVLENKPVQKSKRSISYKAVVLCILATVCLMMVSLKYFSKNDKVKESDVTFSVKKTTSNNIPNTVVFTYDLERANGDSFFIQQSWDRDRRIKIDKDKHTLTDIYYEPGYHNAKLMINDKIVKTTDVFIPTNGWFFYSKRAMFQGLPTYIHAANPVKDGVLSLATEDIVNSKIDPTHENYYFYTFFPEKYDVESDNFIFRTRIRLKEIKNVTCPRIMYELFGQSNSLFFFTTLSGCTGDINANFGEHFLDGKTNDLSGFGCDIGAWKDIEVVVKNKDVKIYINQKEVFSKTYTKSYGLVNGLAFISNGLCEIDHVELKGLDGKIVYASNFNE